MLELGVNKIFISLVMRDNLKRFKMSIVLGSGDLSIQSSQIKYSYA